MQVLRDARVRRPAEAQAAAQASKYYKNDRLEMLRFLPTSPTRLIDIGCGEGFFGEAVKKRFPACETWGIEPVAAVAERAALRNDYVLCSSLEDSSELPIAHFDVVTMNDVLEHIAWPTTALTAVRRILSDEGVLIVSLPNVQFLLNVLDLVKRNEWEYQDSGILDRTHFRFYTAKSAVRLLEQNGFKVERVVGINPMRPKWFYRAVFAMAPGFFYWMPFFQLAVVAKPMRLGS